MHFQCRRIRTLQHRCWEKPAILKEVSDVCEPTLNSIWNKEINTQKCFPDNLKLMDVTPVSKKEDVSLLKNYRPVSVLLVVSKIYERIMQRQILEYIDKH